MKSPSSFRTAAFAGLLLSIAAQAGTVTITGNTGTTGANGTPGLNQDGYAGGNGDAANAVAASPTDAENTAGATGGRGGQGGNGANGNSELPWGGRGGNGGHAGNASATATTDRTAVGGNAKAWAWAVGGTGGTGGVGGWGINGYQAGPPGRSGNGGSANATASAITTTGVADAYATATGGWGDPAANATASANGRNTSNNLVKVEAWARGGRGFMSLDGLGASLGPVTGLSTGGGMVTVTGTLYGGEGGAGPAGGRGGNGGSVSLTDAVTGSTVGVLSLNQSARGGQAGDASFLSPATHGAPGRGGDATSLFSLTDSAASDLRFVIDAFGGNGGGYASNPGAGGIGGAAGTATARLNVVGTGNITSANVSATGGNGGGCSYGHNGSIGGQAVILPSSAVTTGIGKTVYLQAFQRGGNGGAGNATSGGQGADSMMTNVVSGAAPAGTLTLRQLAQGGSGANGINGGSHGGRGGDASSSLEFTGSGEASLVAFVRADPGPSGFVSNTQSTQRAGHATASGNVQDSGDVRLDVIAAGNIGGGAINATATASGVSTGGGRTYVHASANGGLINAQPGHAAEPGPVSVTAYGASQSGDVDVEGNAYGQGSVYGGSYRPTLVAGGNVVLQNAVTGSTTGKLKLIQRAFGGTGAAGTDATTTTRDGGDATSSLVFPNGNPGGGALEGQSQATGGMCYVEQQQTFGQAGSANAITDLQNAGDVIAEATANGGIHQYGFSTYTPAGPANALASAISTVPFGLARATATANGPSGSLSARSKTQGGIISSLESYAARPAASSAQMSVNSLINRAVNTAGYTATTVSAVALPLVPDWSAALSGRPNVAAAMTGTLPLGLVSASLASGNSSARTVFQINPAYLLGNVKLGLVGATVADGSMGTLVVQVKRGATLIVDQSFASLAALAAFFNDQVIDLGPASTFAGQELSVSFAFVGAVASNVSFNAKLVVGAVEQKRLTVNAIGGSVTVSPLQAIYADGQVVTLTAIPDAGNMFIGWSGDLTGSASPATVAMNASKTITASFARFYSGFETPDVPTNSFAYNPTGSDWSFLHNAGIIHSPSAFSTPTAPQGGRWLSSRKWTELREVSSRRPSSWVSQARIN